MVECIEREKAQDGLDNIDWYHVNDKGQLLPGGKSDIETYVPFKAVEEMLKSIPAADVWEVVHCADCAQAEESLVNGCVYCNEMERSRIKEGFCAWGERKTDDG